MKNNWKISKIFYIYIKEMFQIKNILINKNLYGKRDKQRKKVKLQLIITQWKI